MKLTADKGSWEGWDAKKIQRVMGRKGWFISTRELVEMKKRDTLNLKSLKERIGIVCHFYIPALFSMEL